LKPVFWGQSALVFSRQLGDVTAGLTFIE
jgi:hypothetical protein